MRVAQNRAVLSESGFSGLEDFQDSNGGRVWERQALVGIRIGGQSARWAMRNPENPTNPANPDSDKDARIWIPAFAGMTGGGRGIAPSTLYALRFFAQRMAAAVAPMARAAPPSAALATTAGERDADGGGCESASAR